MEAERKQRIFYKGGDKTGLFEFDDGKKRENYMDPWLFVTHGFLWREYLWCWPVRQKERIELEFLDRM